MCLSMVLPLETPKGMDMGTELDKNHIPISISIPIGKFKNPWENPWWLTSAQVFWPWQPWMAINVDYVWYLRHVYVFNSYYTTKAPWIIKSSPGGCKHTKPMGIYPWIWGWIQTHIYTHTRGKVSVPLPIWVWVWRVRVGVGPKYPYPYPCSSLTAIVEYFFSIFSARFSFCDAAHLI